MSYDKYYHELLADGFSEDEADMMASLECKIDEENGYVDEDPDSWWMPTKEDLEW